MNQLRPGQQHGISPLPKLISGNTVLRHYRKLFHTGSQERNRYMIGAVFEPKGRFVLMLPALDEDSDGGSEPSETDIYAEPISETSAET
jgi:hypothetical protein